MLRVSPHELGAGLPEHFPDIIAFVHLGQLDGVVSGRITIARTVGDQDSAIRQLVPAKPVAVGHAADRHEHAVQSLRDLDMAVRILLILDPHTVDEGGELLAKRCIGGGVRLGGCEADTICYLSVIASGAEVIPLEVAWIPLGAHWDAAKQKPERSFSVWLILAWKAREYDRPDRHFTWLH